MTAPEKVEIREIKKLVTAMLEDRDTFKQEIKDEITDLKQTIRDEYIPQKWVGTGASVIKWFIGIGLSIGLIWASLRGTK